MTAQTVTTDVLIIGGGIGGAFAAIRAKEAGIANVTLVSKGQLGSDGASTFGAGVYFGPTPDERDALAEIEFQNDCFGGGLVDQEWLDIAFDQMYDRLQEMDRWGVRVAKGPDGSFRKLVGRGNLPRFRLPGPQTMEAMAKKVIDCGVQVVGFTMITDLLTKDGVPGEAVVGAVGFNVRSGDFIAFHAKAIVLAAGGCGFKSRWSGHRNLTGDGNAMAYRAGAEQGGYEFGNLIVTGTAYDVSGQNPLSGLGAHWVNNLGERYMVDYDPDAQDKAVTSRLSEATAMEIKGGKGPTYLDITHFTAETMQVFQQLYPLSYRLLERVGIIVGGRAIARIEVEPVFVGTFNNVGGGLRISLECETSLPGLYACGDAVVRRLHHPFALQGAAVHGDISGRNAARYAREACQSQVNVEQVEALRREAYLPLDIKDGVDPEHAILRLLEILSPYDVSIIARASSLENALEELARLQAEEVPRVYALDSHGLRSANEARNMTIVAEMYLRSRLLRRESREACLREDFPHVDNVEWLKWTWLKRETRGEMKLWVEDLPIERYKRQPVRNKYLHPVFDAAARRGIQWG